MTTSHLRKTALAAIALSLVAVACGAGATVGSDPPLTEGVPLPVLPETSAPTGEEPAVGTLPQGPSALDNMEDPALPEPAVPAGQVISGGPPPDGIPPIDNPRFLPVIDNLELLDATEAVVALEIDGDARAYPVRVMIWHEIVNDVVGGVPVAVSYCPLCNSASTYIREIDGVVTTFGTSGRLYLSALVMYDRATESLWTHFDGKAIAGVLTGRELEAVASPLLSWEDFRTAYPDGLVLDETETGFNRSYGRNAYVGYDDPDGVPFLFFGPNDDRALALQRIVGVTRDDETKTYAHDVVAGGTARATNDSVGGDPVVILWKSGQSSALDDGSIEGGRDVGSVGVFLSEVDDRILTFTGVDGGFIDDQTASTWSITGDAVDGELQGTRLERVAHLDTFWFAWATYRPETILITESPG